MCQELDSESYFSFSILLLSLNKRLANDRTYIAQRKRKPLGLHTVTPAPLPWPFGVK